MLKQVVVKFFGLTTDCNVAATALCFMIKSQSSRYKDVVAMYLIKNLRAETQKAYFVKVMTFLYEVGFNVIGISVDSAPANRKFFKGFLCGGALKESIVNPFTGGQIFLILPILPRTYKTIFYQKESSHFQPCLRLFLIQLQLVLMTLLQYITINARNLLKLYIA